MHDSRLSRFAFDTTWSRSHSLHLKLQKVTAKVGWNAEPVQPRGLISCSPVRPRVCMWSLSCSFENSGGVWLWANLQQSTGWEGFIFLWLGRTAMITTTLQQCNPSIKCIKIQQKVEVRFEFPAKVEDKLSYFVAICNKTSECTSEQQGSAFLAANCGL